MREKVTRAVYTAVRAIGEDFDIAPLKVPDEATRLFGAKSGVDSVTLVSLIAEVEDQLAEVTGQALVLADERAMSQTRSPFRRVNTLIDYICERLQEEDA